MTNKPTPEYEALDAAQQGETEYLPPPDLEAHMQSVAETGMLAPTNLRGIESNKTRRARFIAGLILKGFTRSEISQQVQEKYGVTPATAAADITRLRDQARLANDDTGKMEVVVAELTTHAIKRARMFHAEVVAPIPEDMLLTPRDLQGIARQRIESDKAARANAEFVIEVFGRTSPRWSKKTQLDLNPLDTSGTAEQRQAVNRLLGIDTPVVDVTPIEEGTTE